MAHAPSDVDRNEEEQSVFTTAFDEKTRRALLDEDAFAWHSVCAELITIVGLGLLLGLLAVAIIM